VPFSTDIIEHFLWSDLVVAAAGSVAWELALLRVPMALIVAADNQQAVTEPLGARGAALLLGDFRSFDPDKAALQISNVINDYSARLLLSTRCHELIDCHGAQRVVDAMEMTQ
jgi:spore coat polysaccharide biosynthesis predicted glycosyltransferase SpsG